VAAQKIWAATPANDVGELLTRRHHVASRVLMIVVPLRRLHQLAVTVLSLISRWTARSWFNDVPQAVQQATVLALSASQSGAG
jgi:hypothetical protein